VVEEGRAFLFVETIAAVLVPVIVGEGVVGLSFVWPGGIHVGETVKRNAFGEGDAIVATELEAAMIDTGELTFPKVAEIHFTGVEDETDAFGVSHPDATVAGRATTAAHHCFIGDAKFTGLAGEALGILGALAIGKVGPKGFDLLIGVAVENFLSDGLTAGPVAGHDDGGVEAGRLAHVKVEPIFLKSFGSVNEVEGSRSTGFLTVEIVAGDATETTGSGHFVTGVFGLTDIDNFGKGRFLQRIDLPESLDKMTHVGLTKKGHAGVEVFALAAAVNEDFLEPGFGELGADVSEGRRKTALVTEGFRGAGEVGIALGRNSAEAFAIVTSDAVEGGEGFVDQLVIGKSNGTGFRQGEGDEFSLLGSEIEMGRRRTVRETAFVALEG